MINSSSSNITNYTFDSCDYLKFEWSFLTLTILLLLISLSAIWMSGILYQLIRQYELFHANVRLLLLNCCLGNLLSNFCTTLRACYNLSILVLGANSFSMTRLECIAVELPYTISQIVFLSSMAAIGFERCSATVKQNLSDPTNSSTVIKVAAASFWFLGLFNTLLFAFDIIAFCDVKQVVCYCFIALMGTDKVLYISAVSYIIFLTLCLTCYFFVYCKNKQAIVISINTARHSLQERYQIWNNVATTRMLLPSVISCSLVYVILLSSHFYTYSLFWIDKMPNTLNVIMVIISTSCLNGFIQPLLLIAFEEKLRSAAAKKYKIFRFVFRYGRNGRKIVSNTKDAMQTQVFRLDRSINVVPYHVDPNTSKQIIEEFWNKKA